MTVMRSSLALKHVGNGKQAALLTTIGEKVFIGTIAGIASGIKNGKMPDGVTPSIGLTGNFEATPADPKAEGVASGVCYLPDSLQAPIINALEDEVDSEGKVTKAGANSVLFAYEVYAVKDGNKAGFTWEFRSAIKPTENDPLAEARKQLAAMQAERQALLAAPKK